jgi:alcohol dehydrogenase (NADP+)
MQNKNLDLLDVVDTAAVKRRAFIKQTSAMAVIASVPSSLQVLADNSVSENIATKGFAANNTSGILSPFRFDRRPVGDNDVQIEILYCGVCHSDIHSVRSEWRPEKYPLVPGHELAGRVIKVGKNVTKFKIGDHAGVGCMVDSCGTCTSCMAGHEQYCDKNETIYTYGSPDKILGGITQGGYSKTIVVKDSFVISIPMSMDLKTAAPILCAGVTTFSPILAWHVKKGMTVGVAGIGGLGHMAIKLAVAKGADVIAFTTSPSKVADIKRFGAKEVVVVDDVSKLTPYTRKMDYMISTIPAKFNIDAYLTLVKRDATFTQLGIGAEPLSVNMNGLTQTRVNFIGSLIGGIAETQEVINFCALNNIAPEIELINIKDINDTMNNIVAKKARYRYVIDMATL